LCEQGYATLPHHFLGGKPNFMKKLKLIYNPNAGDKTFRLSLDDCISVFQEAGFFVDIFRSMKKGDIERALSRVSPYEYDTIVVAGGDGSINIVVNSMMTNGIRAKLGIIPAGTANDFASYLKISKKPKEAAQVIANGKVIDTDIGFVGSVGSSTGKYFINVCGVGVLSNISHHTDPDFKNVLGKIAYYIKGIEEFQNLTPLNVKITNSQMVIEEKIYTMLVLNSSGVGSFEKINKEAKIDDGVFEFIAVKCCPLTDMAMLGLKVLRGDYLGNPNIIYFKDSYVKIELLEDVADKILLETDIDGELGPNIPIEIKNLTKALKIYCA